MCCFRLLVRYLRRNRNRRIECFRLHRKDSLVTPLTPGSTAVYTATPVPAGSLPTKANPATWVSSDPVNAPISSVDELGLNATVAPPASAIAGSTFVLTISYTNADGTVATGSVSDVVVAAPSPDIASFIVARTA